MSTGNFSITLNQAKLDELMTNFEVPVAQRLQLRCVDHDRVVLETYFEVGPFTPSIGVEGTVRPLVSFANGGLLQIELAGGNSERAASWIAQLEPVRSSLPHWIHFSNGRQIAIDVPGLLTEAGLGDVVSHLQNTTVAVLPDGLNICGTIN